MKLPARARKRGVGFDMTPMIDVVFLLIIFFLVASRLSQQDVMTPLDLPIAASGRRAVVDDTPTATINVLPDGSTTLAGRPVEGPALVERLSAIRVEAGSDVEIRVRLDREAPYSALEPALVACARAGVWNVQIAVLREEDAP